jgi:hypothetical protein
MIMLYVLFLYLMPSTDIVWLDRGNNRHLALVLKNVSDRQSHVHVRALCVHYLLGLSELPPALHVLLVVARNSDVAKPAKALGAGSARHVDGLFEAVDGDRDVFLGRHDGDTREEEEKVNEKEDGRKGEDRERG